MPPQQPKGLLDLADDGRNFRAHDFTGSKEENIGKRDVATPPALRKRYP
jgi:hypothetical protein